MRIEFDPTNPTEAAAVRAMLTALTPHQTAEGQLISRTVSVNNGPAVTVFPQQHNPVKLHDEDGGVTVNLDTKRITVASDTTTVPETDSQDEPHDPRIHSTPPKLNADGTWRAKRGVTAEQIAAVRAEREQSYDTDVTPEGVAQVREKAAEALANADLEPVVSAPPAPPVMAAPPAPIVAPLPTEAEVAVHFAPSFLDVMKAITAAQKDGKIDTAKVKELCAAVGAGESTMGLNGPDNGDKRVAFLRVVSLDPEARDALIAAAKDAPGVDTFRALLGDA